jgi:hypothetical protein
MAVLVQKFWNATAGVIPKGVAVSFSRNGYYLYVLNSDGVEIAKFKAEHVQHYWIEVNPRSSLPTTMSEHIE